MRISLLVLVLAVHPLAAPAQHAGEEPGEGAPHTHGPALTGPGMPSTPAPPLPGEQEVLEAMDRLRQKLSSERDPKAARAVEDQLIAKLKEYQKRYSQSPRIVVIMPHLIRMLISRQDDRGAMAVALDLMKTRTDPAQLREATIFAADVHRRLGDWVTAVKILSGWLEGNEAQIEAAPLLIALADVLADDGRYAEAKGAIDRFVGRHLASLALGESIGRITALMADNLDFEGARALIDSFMSRHPSHPHKTFLKMRKADLLITDHHEKEALDILGEIRPSLQGPEARQGTLLSAIAHSSLARAASPTEAARHRKQAQDLFNSLTGPKLEQRDDISVQAVVHLVDLHLDSGNAAGARALLSAAAKAFEGEAAGDSARKALADLDLIGQSPPTVRFQSIDGRSLSLADLAGGVAVVFFWASWHTPSLEEISTLRLIHRTLAPRGVKVLSVSVDNPGLDAHLKRFMATSRMDWPEAYDGRGFDSPLAKALKVKSIPQSFVLDERGRIVRVGLVGTHLVDVVRRKLWRGGTGEKRRR